jgi:hypothetical protein
MQSRDAHHSKDKDDKARTARLHEGFENFSAYLADQFRPYLKSKGFDDTAAKLSQHLELFDEEWSKLYHTEHMSPEEIKAAYDASGAALARMTGLAYRHVHEHCHFGDDYTALTSLQTAMQEFNGKAPNALEAMGLEYHEFDSLTLELEAKLGVNAASEPAEKHSERRRRLPKNPNKIEMALRDCLETAHQIRPLITNDDRRDTLDRITGEVGSILSNLPKGDDDISKGRRISALISATAKILKVSKWIRKVDLLETEQSESAKREISRRFDDLKDLSHGHEPGNHR